MMIKVSTWFSLDCNIACTDIDFWRMPSRHFYVAKNSDFEELRKSKKLSLKRNTSIGCGHYVDLTASESDNRCQLDWIEEIVKNVCTK